MCGILGAVGNFEKDRFQRALKRVSHRGPDHCGIYAENGVHFGHTRLAIIDLLDEANQPFIKDQYVLIFNGEIYNFHELTKKYNLECYTKSDSEVIISLYEKIGLRFLEELEGLFAFGLYDSEEQKIVLARDRFGKKPLFFYHHDNEFIFASEMKSLLALLDFKPALNIQALQEYLAYLAPLVPNTFFEGIKKLESSHYMIYDLNSNLLKIDKYYDLIDSYSKIEKPKCIEELIFSSVQSRLLSDVKIASLLSGGVDSTLISALYSKIANKKISTFSIGYEEHKKYDELEFAKIASKFIGSNSHEYRLKRDEFLESIDLVISIFDEPLGDSASIPLFFLSKAVHQEGFKVALSGEGSDEIFLGYDRYLSIIENKRVGEYGGFIEAFSPSELSRLMPNAKDIRRFEQIHERIGGDSKVLSTIDLSHWIPEVLMSKVDRMSMASSVEVRSPFLDRNLVENVLSIKESEKLKGGTKALLKEIAIKFIPKEIVYRKKKGFSSPYFEWYYSEYGDEILELFFRVNKRVGLFNQDYLKILYNHRDENRQKLWSLIIFCRWFESYYDREFL